MFYYCDSESAWVFTIKALHKSDFPESGCKHEWLMKSQRTEAMKLEDVGKDGWQVWTGSSTAASLGMICNQCYIDSDCGGHGKCQQKSCSCKATHTGKHCEFETPFCPRLKLTVLGDDALSFRQRSEFDLVVQSDGQNRWVYNRPWFKNATKDEIVFYSGTRWLQVLSTAAIEITLELEEHDIDHFHAYWHLDVLLSLWEYSDPTDSETPIGASWNLLDSNAAVGHSAPYGMKFPFKQKYVCGRCPNTTNYCGEAGICNVVTGFCVCNATTGVGGDYCEFEPVSPYVAPLAAEFWWHYQNAVSLNRTWYPYAELYWKDLTDLELYGLFGTLYELF